MAIKKMPGCQYWVAQFRVNGRLYTRSTHQTDPRKAEKVAEEMKRQVRLVCVRPGAAHKLSEARVAEVARLEADVSHWQADRAEYGLWNFQAWAGDINLDRIDTTMLEEFQRTRLKVVSKETADKELIFIAGMLRRNGYAVEKPRSKPGRVTEQRPFNREELKRFFEHCPEDFRALFLLMLCTGARPAELIPSFRSSHTPILKSEVDYDESIVTIRSAKVMPGRKGKVRRIKIQPALADELQAVAQSHSLKSVFKPVLNLFRYFNRILVAAGIERLDPLGRKVTAHSFRHTFATLMAESVNHNPFMVQHLLGHSQIATTARYCHPANEAQVVNITDLMGETVVKTVVKEKPEGVARAS